jgi:hypothetical protein
MKLSASQVKSAKPAEKSYKLSDGRGMFLHVMTNGAKYWRLKYRFSGKEKLLSMGVYPAISLAEARSFCDEAKALLRSDRDPGLVKQLKKNFSQKQSENSFEAVANEWFEAKISGISQGYKTRTLRILEKDLFPAIGKNPISELTAPLLLDALRLIEKRTVYIAHRAKQTVSQVMRYAVATGRADRDIAPLVKERCRATAANAFMTMMVSMPLQVRLSSILTELIVY